MEIAFRGIYIITMGRRFLDNERAILYIPQKAIVKSFFKDVKPNKFDYFFRDLIKYHGSVVLICNECLSFKHPQRHYFVFCNNQIINCQIPESFLKRIEEATIEMLLECF